MKGHKIAWPSAEKVILEDFDLPEVRPATVLVETEYTAISPGTELAFLCGLSNTSASFPQYPGYSGVGRVIEIGEAWKASPWVTV